MSDNSNDVELRKRVSPVDYYDGYIAGLNAVRDLINHHINLAIETKEIAIQMAKENSHAKPPQ